MQAKWHFINENMHQTILNEENIDIFVCFKQQARLGAQFAVLYPQYHKLGIMLRKEKGNNIYKIAIEYLGADSENILEGMISQGIEKGDFKNDIPSDFIIKIIGYLFEHFDDIFDTAEDFELEKILANLDLYVDFMKFGIGKKT